MAQSYLQFSFQAFTPVCGKYVSKYNTTLLPERRKSLFLILGVLAGDVVITFALRVEENALQEYSFLRLGFGILTDQLAFNCSFYNA